MNNPRTRPVSRRSFLKTLVIGGTGGLAGCIGNDGSEPERNHPSGTTSNAGGFGEEYLPVEPDGEATYFVEVRNIQEFVGNLIVAPNSFPDNLDEVSIHGEHDRKFFQAGPEGRPDHYLIGGDKGWAETFTPGVHESGNVPFVTVKQRIFGRFGWWTTADERGGVGSTALAPHYQKNESIGKPPREEILQDETPFHDHVSWEAIGGSNQRVSRGIFDASAMLTKIREVNDYDVGDIESYQIELGHGNWAASARP